MSRNEIVLFLIARVSDLIAGEMSPFYLISGGDISLFLNASKSRGGTLRSSELCAWILCLCDGFFIITSNDPSSSESSVPFPYMVLPCLFMVFSF